MSHAIPAPERVPFRGTEYVHAREFDAAVAVANRLAKDKEQLERTNGQLLREITDLRFPPKPARAPGLFSRLFRL